MTLKPISLTAIGLALLATTACAGTHGYSAGTVNTRASVSYSDLDIGRTPGAQAMLVRIKAAARTVCGPSPELRDLAGQQTFKTCMNDSVERAVSDLGSVVVSDLHRNGDRWMSIAQRD